MTLLADCYTQFDAATLRGWGFAGASRYVSHDPGKCTSAGVIAADQAYQFLHQLNFEDGAMNAAGGYQQGLADADFACQTAQQLGYVPDHLIAFSVDFEANSSNIGAVIGYAQALQHVCPYYGYIGAVYGSAYVIDVCVGDGYIGWGWQTAAWSGGELSTHAYLYQEAFGQSFDTNELLIATAPIWGLSTPTPPPKPKPKPKIHIPQPPQQEDDMAFLARTTGAKAGRIKPNQVYVIAGAQAVYVPNGADLPVLEKEYGAEQPLSCATVNSFGRP